MQIVLANNRFEAISAFHEKDALKACRWRWSPLPVGWWDAGGT